jgi:hypothetical protein
MMVISRWVWTFCPYSRAIFPKKDTAEDTLTANAVALLPIALAQIGDANHAHGDEIRALASAIETQRMVSETLRGNGALP